VSRHLQCSTPRIVKRIEDRVHDRRYGADSAELAAAF